MTLAIFEHAKVGDAFGQLTDERWLAGVLSNQPPLHGNRLIVLLPRTVDIAAIGSQDRQVVENERQLPSDVGILRLSRRQSREQFLRIFVFRRRLRRVAELGRDHAGLEVRSASSCRNDGSLAACSTNAR